MARSNTVRVIGGDAPPVTSAAPPEYIKARFARELYKRMIEKGWRQSELARQADLGRDSVSKYVRGVTLPDPTSLARLAKALRCDTTDLLPSMSERGVQDELPAIELRQSVTQPGRAWLRINREVSFGTAAKVIAILEAEKE